MQYANFGYIYVLKSEKYKLSKDSGWVGKGEVWDTSFCLPLLVATGLSPLENFSSY